MQKLRTLHLYLGCIFAPMLVFFAISGIWQTFGLHYQSQPGTLTYLSTIHTSRPFGLKSDTRATPPHTWSGPVMRGFVLAMSGGLVVTTMLGVVMAIKFGRSRKLALACLAFGILFPLTLVLIKVFA